MRGHEKDIHTNAIVGADGSVRVDRLPIQAGQAVGITIHPLETAPSTPSSSRYPLAGCRWDIWSPSRG